MECTILLLTTLCPQVSLIYIVCSQYLSLSLYEWCPPNTMDISISYPVVMWHLYRVMWRVFSRETTNPSWVCLVTYCESSILIANTANVAIVVEWRVEDKREIDFCAHTQRSFQYFNLNFCASVAFISSLILYSFHS